MKQKQKGYGRRFGVSERTMRLFFISIAFLAFVAGMGLAPYVLDGPALEAAGQIPR